MLSSVDNSLTICGHIKLRLSVLVYFFFNDTTTTEIYTLSLHDALPISKNVITSCSVTMMLFLHLEVKPLMTLTTVLYLSCALISGHLAMMLMELTKRR